MSNIIKISIILASISILPWGCNQDNLVPLKKNMILNPYYISVNSNFCNSAPHPKYQKYKYLFILDHSQSNQIRPIDPSVPVVSGDIFATDPTGARRYGPLAEFVTQLVPDPYTSVFFSLINFNTTAFYANGTSYFDGNQGNFLNNVNADWMKIFNQSNPNDFGFTDYSQALTKAISLIKADLSAESNSLSSPVIASNYQIIFVSDGVPTISLNGGTTTRTQNFSNDIQPSLDQLNALLSDPILSTYVSNISFNTVYYYQQSSDLNARALLKQMATYLNGQYFEFGNGDTINYYNFAPPTTNLKFLLSDVFIENETAVFWKNGKLMYDTDGDGIPDDIEASLGSDPNSKDSDKNGVSDLVEYNTKGKPCNGASCSPAGRDTYSICNGFSPQIAAGGAVQFSITSKDGLNECEKYILGANTTDFNSNGNFIPDMLAVKYSIPFLKGANESFADPFGDGLSNYQKIKAGYPITISKNKLLNFSPRKLTLEHIDSTASDLECYSLRADNVLAYGDNNTFKIYVIENVALVDDHPILKVAERTVNGHESPLTFSPEDFK